MKKPQLISLLICAYCLLNAADLLETWSRSHRSLMGALALALWCSPIGVFWLLQARRPLATRERPVLLCLAMALSFLGKAGSLRVLEHAGLAFALSALLPPLALHPVWLASSLSWMPFLDWLGGRFFPGYLTIVRVAMAAVPALFLIRSVRRNSGGGA